MNRHPVANPNGLVWHDGWFKPGYVIHFPSSVGIEDLRCGIEEFEKRREVERKTKEKEKKPE